jgi:hypothetical protein
METPECQLERRMVEALRKQVRVKDLPGVRITEVRQEPEAPFDVSFELTSGKNRIQVFGEIKEAPSPWLLAEIGPWMQRMKSLKKNTSQISESRSMITPSRVSSLRFLRSPSPPVEVMPQERTHIPSRRPASRLLPACPRSRLRIRGPALRISLRNPGCPRSRRCLCSRVPPNPRPKCSSLGSLERGRSRRTFAGDCRVGRCRRKSADRFVAKG